MDLGIKKAKILRLFPHGIRVLVDGHVDFVKRCDIDWGNPDIDVFRHYKEGDEIDVAVLPFYNDELYLSVKHVKYDPWNKFISAYVKHAQDKTPYITTGVVAEVLNNYAYITLSDYNTAILYKKDIDNLLGEGGRHLGEILFVGDHVKGVVVEVDDKAKKIELSVNSYIINLYNTLELAKNNTARLTYKIKTVLGDTLESAPQASNKPLADGKTDTRKLADQPAYSNHSVLLIENEPSQANKLKSGFDKLGIASDIHIVNNNSSHNLENKLQNVGNYTCVFIDKHLGVENGIKHAKRILNSNPNYAVIMITAEDRDDAVRKLKLENLQDNVFLLTKPVTTKEITIALEWSQKSCAERLSAIATRNELHESQQDVPESALIEKTLANLCAGGSRKAIILEMDTTTMEISLLFSLGLKENNWDKYKTTIRHTPLFDTIKQKKLHVFVTIPEKRTKHFPPEIKDAKSLIGVPLKVFEETNYGLFIFDFEGETPIRNMEPFVLASAEKLSLLLERYLFKKGMMDESRFKIMGVLYAAMRHEILSLVSSASSFDIVAEWDKLKTCVANSNTEVENLKTEFRDNLKMINSSLQEMNRLFDFYSMLDKGGEEYVQIDLEKLINEVKDSVAKTDDATGVAIEIINRTDNRSLVIKTSETRMRHIIRNVLVNACQQMREWELPVKNVTIELDYGDSDEERPIKAYVADTGPGIHKKDFGRVFSPLFTKRKGGTGLDLSICKEFLLAMGGKISIDESYILAGTTFLIELPVRGL